MMTSRFIRGCILSSACAVSFLALVMSARNGLAQEPQVGTPLPAVTPSSPAPLQDDSITRYLSGPIKEISRKKLPAELESLNITRVSPEEEQIKIALAIVEADISAEVLFTRETDATSYRIDFKPEGVLIGSSQPRYESLERGVQVSFDRHDSKIAWFEGKRYSSVIFIIPPMFDCGTRIVLACPRMFSGTQSLTPSGYHAAGIRYFAEGKADGLFRPLESDKGRVIATLVGSERMPLPDPARVEALDVTAPRATVKSTKGTPTLAFSRGVLPFTDFLEARLEFGTPEHTLRSARARATISVSEFSLSNTQEVQIENSSVALEPGPCAVIAQRKESQF